MENLIVVCVFFVMLEIGIVGVAIISRLEEIQVQVLQEILNLTSELRNRPTLHLERSSLRSRPQLDLGQKERE